MKRRKVMDDKQLDSLFRQKLSNYEVKPSVEAWERLASKMESKPKRLVWLRYVASLALVLGSVFVARELLQSEGGSQPPLVTHLTEQLFELPDITMDFEQGPREVENSLAASKAPSVNQRVPKATNQVAELPKETNVRSDVSSIELVEPFELAQTIDLLAEVQAEWPEQFGSVMDQRSEIVMENNEITVRIVSNGHAFVTDKPDLIEGIEGGLDKLGGLMAKVDKGFSDFQDVKNNFFASVISQKRDRKEKPDK
ncbi:MAG: hypothetical protein JJU34_03340 [Lunatimonas sp.]|uniref:hypothetical protein n=1 Tax=Lunatimonas sp. TaxID=2060141 RepID=UPI00263BB389|nr:hypothetical protein [Lunatimonas sp.]MCC5936296.1 hypothetical protein [Lunatimonas sp.]